MDILEKSYCKNLWIQETALKRRERASRSYRDYNWEELLLTIGLNYLYVLELDLYSRNHPLPWKKKLKNGQLELITTHLKEIRAEALRTRREPEAVSGDNDDHEGKRHCFGQCKYISASCYWLTMLITNRAQNTCHRTLIWPRVTWHVTEWGEWEWGGWREWVWAKHKGTL